MITLAVYSKWLADNRSDIEHIWQTFWRHGFYRGGPVFMSALSGIDIAALSSWPSGIRCLAPDCVGDAEFRHLRDESGDAL